MEVPLQKRKDKPVPITVENDIQINNGSKTVHKAEYYYIYTEGEHNDIFVEYVEDTVSMEFKKDRWVLTNIERVTTPVYLNSQLFKQEYYDLLAKNNGEVIKSVEKLSLRYPWIPQKHKMIKEQDRLIEKYNDPYGFLK